MNGWGDEGKCKVRDKGLRVSNPGTFVVFSEAFMTYGAASRNWLHLRVR